MISPCIAEPGSEVLPFNQSPMMSLCGLIACHNTIGRHLPPQALFATAGIPNQLWEVGR